MNIFLLLVLKILPLYFFIALGFIAAKILGAKKETIAKLLIYIIAPAVIFLGTYNAKLTLATLSLPVLFFFVASFNCLLFFKIGKIFWKNERTRNILAFTSGAGNTGYFGLPVVLAFFDEHKFSLAVLSVLGFILYENTIGFFISAKAHHTVKESINKVLKLPTIYAFSFGLILNIFDVKLGEISLNALGNFKGAYTLLGMMMIGMGLSTVRFKSIDIKFITLSFIAKFLVWPLLIGSIIFLDKEYFHFYGSYLYPLMILMSVVPLAANTVAVATELDLHPDKASAAVLLSTVFALFYVPFITSYLLN